MHSVGYFAVFKKSCLRLCLIFLLSYQILYFNYKYYTPKLGGLNFFHYYPMYLHPLDLGVSKAPFVLRQLSAVLVYALAHSGFDYNTEIRFQEAGISQAVFLCALTINYVGLVFGALIAGFIFEELVEGSTKSYSFLASLVCLLSFHVNIFIVTGLVEGVTLFLFAALYLAYLKRSYLFVVLLTSLAAIERETILILFVLIPLFTMCIARKYRHFDIFVSAVATSFFVLYILFRKFSGVVGYPEQLDPMKILHYFLSIGDLLRDPAFLSQIIGTSNILIGIILTFFFTPRISVQMRRFFILCMLLLGSLLVVGIGANIGSNVARVFSILVPLLAVLLAYQLSLIFETHCGATSSLPAEPTADDQSSWRSHQ